MPGPIDLQTLLEHFPRSRRYREPRVAQTEILEFVAERGSAIVEAPTGVGKTAVEYAILKAGKNLRREPLFLIVPNKTILAQIHEEFPDGLKVALGRNEHPCLYYEEDKNDLDVRLPILAEDPEAWRADEIPCSMLTDCPHRVNQDTGKTHEKGAVPCPYLHQKFEAKQGGVVLCTMAFYLFTQLFSREFDRPGILVIDEAHRMAEVVRNALSYEITDHHLERSIELLQLIEAEEYKVLRRFLRTMIRIIKSKSRGKPPLLEPSELRTLMNILAEVDINELGKKIDQAVRQGLVDVREDRTTLRQLEILLRDLRRYIRSFEFSLQDDEHGRNALNYTYAAWREEREEGQKVQYKLVVKGYYVAPLIKKILGRMTVALSATIGDQDVFGYETGIRKPFLSVGSQFPAERTRVFMPTDTPNLAVKSRSSREPTKVLRRIAKTCNRFARKEIRCLVVVVSNREREKFLMLAEEEGINTVSYGNGMTAKEAAIRFREGEGDVLVGTAANYSEGVDLPRGIAPVIFVLRPGYPNPSDPGAIFEERRFGSQRWQLWNWRVMISALQARGRNIRSKSDMGVTFFVSQQFRRFVFASLPESLRREGVYVGDKTFEACIRDAERLLS